MSKKRYLFFDIDGTLVAGGYGKGYVPDSAQEALAKLRKAGHFLCIATGRSQAMAVDYMKELGFLNMVSDGGYGITIDGKLLGIAPLVKEDVIDLIDECKRKGLPWGLQTDNSMIRSIPDESFLEAANDTYMRMKVVPGLDPRKCDEIYKAYVACTYPEEHSIEALKKLPWCRFHDTYLFVEPADKAAGIRRVLEHFGADCRDAVVFGDARNDLSMFTDDGWFKVAMGNAVPEIKERADLVTDDVDKDGIYNACEKLGLFEAVTPDEEA